MPGKKIHVAGKVFNAGGDAKTSKGQDGGVLTAICYMAPATSVLQHYPDTPRKVANVCPHASAGCIAACLNTAGRGAFSTTQKARARKTHRFVSDPGAFLRDAADDLRRMANRAAKEGMALHVRPDGTSDVLTGWLAVRWTQLVAMAASSGRGLTPEGRRTLEGAQLYTYTKRPASDFADLPNVHVTYSWNERPDNMSKARGHAEAGHNLAVVFRDRATLDQAIANGFNGWPVIDGDLTDNRADDPKGSVVGLVAKGRAKTDTSGFVVDL